IPARACVSTSSVKNTFLMPSSRSNGCADTVILFAKFIEPYYRRSNRPVMPYLEPVPKPSVQPTLSRAFVAHFVEPCSFWPFSTKWSDKVHDKGPHTPFVGHA